VGLMDRSRSSSSSARPALRNGSATSGCICELLAACELAGSAHICVGPGNTPLPPGLALRLLLRASTTGLQPRRPATWLPLRERRGRRDRPEAAAPRPLELWRSPSLERHRRNLAEGARLSNVRNLNNCDAGEALIRHERVLLKTTSSAPGCKDASAPAG